MKDIMILLFTLAIAGCAIIKESSYHAGAPGYLDVQMSEKDKIKHVYLKPASLFDSDDSVGVFRLGFFWMPKMGDAVDFIVSIPVEWDSDFELIKNNIRDLLIVIGNKKIHLKKAKNAFTVKEKDIVIRKEYRVQYRYRGSKKLLVSMIGGGNVNVQLSTPDKLYVGQFDLNGKYRERYKSNRHNAYNGASRFVKAIN